MQSGIGQTGLLGLGDDIRDRILADPSMLLEDAEVMRALVAANDRAMGENIVDLRGVAMRRLEGRLDRLENTHRSVIAAAYENLAGTNIVHRAVLQILEPASFEAYLAVIGKGLRETLRVDSTRLLLESQHASDLLAAQLDEALCVVEEGFVERYVTAGREGVARPVVLRQIVSGGAQTHGGMAPHIRSEAVMRLDLGAGRLPGMLVLGAEDPHHFSPSQGTDLLTFFARVFQISLRRWLA